MQGMVQPFREGNPEQDSYNSFVSDNTSNSIKLVKFGVGPQIFINKARIR